MVRLPAHAPTISVSESEQRMGAIEGDFKRDSPDDER